jgi:osmotically-inducible protein OsmY
MILKKISVLFALSILIFSTSCVETVLVGTAATATIVLREKTLKNTQYDAIIAAKLNTEFVGRGLKNLSNSVDVTVNEKRVLLTGIVRDQEKAKLAVDLSWKAGDVKEVIDEIQISDDEKLRPKDFSKTITDYFLTSRVELGLLFGKDISSVNYKVTTVRGEVYLLGLAADEEELHKALSLISRIRGVKKVINHVILSNDSRRSRQ